MGKWEEIREEFKKGLTTHEHPYDKSSPDICVKNNYERSVEDTIQLYKDVQAVDKEIFSKHEPYFENYGKYDFVKKNEKYSIYSESLEKELKVDFNEAEKYKVGKVDDKTIIINKEDLLKEQENKIEFNQLAYDGRIEKLCNDYKEYYGTLNNENNKQIQIDSFEREVPENIAKEFTKKFEEINNKFTDIRKFDLEYTGNSKILKPNLKTDEEIKKESLQEKTEDKSLSIREKFEKQKEQIRQQEKTELVEKKTTHRLRK